jgi:NAD(P)-dependent dehydrogenase (short-subunit alcohol dehydrogenase family)
MASMSQRPSSMPTSDGDAQEQSGIGPAGLDAVGAAPGRVALITGGASGIGMATAERLVAAGWKVAVADRNETALEAWRQRPGGAAGVLLAPFDVTDETAAQAAVARAAEALGGLDGVVNAAGIAADIPALDTPVELFRRVLDINVTGTFIVARAAARIMKERGGGAIVNLASVAGLRGSKGRSAYGASKGAVVVLTQVLANDLARYGIRVNAVAPGPVDTPMVQAMHTAEDRALWTRHIPMRRYGTPEEIASVIEVLLDGTRSGYITGEVIAVDGGFRGAGIIADG